MTRRLTAADVGDKNIDQAARAGRAPSQIDVDRDRAQALTRMPPPPRPPVVAKPVTWRDLNGRPPGGWPTRWPFAHLPPMDGGWEADAIVAARERERAAEAVLLAGTGTGRP